jgi:hypothetical protein
MNGLHLPRENLRPGTPPRRPRWWERRRRRSETDALIAAYFGGADRRSTSRRGQLRCAALGAGAGLAGVAAVAAGEVLLLHALGMI